MMKQYTHILWFGIAAALLLLACRSESVERLKAHSAGAMLEAAGWSRLAKAIPPGQTIAAYLEAQNQGNTLAWDARGRGDLTEIVAQRNGPQPQTWTFLTAPNAAPVSLDMDVAGAWRLGISPRPESSRVWLRSDHQHEVHRQHDGSARYIWTGCLKHEGNELFTDLEMRATLLTVDKSGQRTALAGKPRHATDRSGIPKQAGIGAYFCTTLKSGKLPEVVAQSEGLTALGVLEMSWELPNGARRFATLSSQPLDWDVYHGTDGPSIAIVSGGPLKLSNELSFELPSPSLVTVLKRDGNTLSVRTADGKQGRLEAERIVARYPLTTPEIDKVQHEHLMRLAQLAAQGKYEKALNLFKPAEREKNSAEILVDLKRRFPAQPNADTLRPVVQILEARPNGTRLLVSYFVWLKRDATAVWQSYDVALFEGEQFIPIQLKPTAH